jgi:hypothetical protein
MNEPATDVKAPPGAPPPHYFLTRPRIFGYDLIVLVVLMLLGFWYIKWPDYFSWLSPSFKLAVESMWFGSLGGVIISLKGIYDHSGGSEAWDPSFNLWHLGRPVSGAIAGLMTVVLLMAVSSGKDSALSTPVVYASAFIFGTQERRFFNFLYEVARLIVQVPEEAKTGFVLSDIQPPGGRRRLRHCDYGHGNRTDGDGQTGHGRGRQTRRVKRWHQRGRDSSRSARRYRHSRR